MAAESKKRLALAICDFLNTSITDGTLPADEKENMEVAVQCIADSFKIDPADKAAVSSAIGSQNLYQIYSVYEKLKNASSSATASSSASTAAAPPTTSELTEEKKKEAEALKSRGNAAMQQKDYAGAIDLYTQALAINPQNAVYLSNRSAAYHNSKNYEAAKTDALACTQLDPTYTKGWSRLGLALYALDDAKGSMEAYKRGIEAEGSGGSDTMKRGYAAAKQRAEALEGSSTDLNRDADSATSTPSGAGGMPSLAEMASMFGGGGRGGGAGAGGGGGMPDFASIMSNPMFQNMAQNMMSNPDLMSNLMSNPRLREMANQFQSGGSMPDMASLMSDPSIAEMARSMMGGGGAGRGAGQ